MRRPLLVGALLAGLLGGPAPAAAVVSGNLEAVFTDVSVAGVADPLIADRLVSLVDGAAASSTVRAALPDLTEQAVADALLAAQARGVTVLAVGERCPAKDGAGTCQAPSPTLAALAAGLAPGRFTWCDEGCLSGTGALAASTFWVFDTLADGRTDVVVQPSAGPTAGATLRHHNLLISANDAPLAAAHRGYFDQLVARTPVTFTGSVVGAGGRTEVFFHPRAAGETDILSTLVNDVQCPGGAIRVAAGVFAADRTGLVNTLVAKAAAGCSVYAILSDRNSAMSTLASNGVTVDTYRPGGCRLPADGSCEAGDLGSQYVLVEGVSTKTGTTKKFVYTGSGGYTDQALRRDDGTLVKIDDGTIYAAYLADFDGILDQARLIRPDQWPNASHSAVNSVATGDQDNSQVAASRNGHVAVVWEDDRDSTDPASEYHSEVFIRMYKDGAGVYEKKVTTGGTGNWRHIRPDVAVNDNGAAVVAWMDDPDGNGYYNIAVVTVSASGTVSGLVHANVDGTGQQMYPAVAIEPDSGAFVVVWEDRATSPYNVRAARYASISSKSWEVRVNNSVASTGGGHLRPDVGMDAAGDAIVVWQEDQDGNAYYNIGLKGLTASGGVKFSQRSANAVGDQQQVDPTVAVNFNGDFAVAWRDNRTGAERVYLRSFNYLATAAHTDRPVIEETGFLGEPLGAQYDPRIGIDDQRNVVVGWSEAGYAGYEPWARGFNENGTTDGRFPAARMSVRTTGVQAHPALAVSAWGEITFCYTDDADGNAFDQVHMRSGFSNSLW